MDIIAKAQEKIGALTGTIHALRLQREAIEAQLNRHEHELAKLRSFIATFRELEGQPETVTQASAHGPFARVVSSAEKTRTGLAPKQIEVIVAAYLKENSPKRTSELVEYLESKGCEIPSDRKESYLAGVLSRSVLFVARRRHGGWFLRENDPVAEKFNLFEARTPEEDFSDMEKPQSETPPVSAGGVSNTSTEAAWDGGPTQTD